MPLALSPMLAPTPSPSELGSMLDGEAAHGEPPRPKRRSREPDTHTHQQKRSAFSTRVTLLNDELITMMALVTC